MEHRIERFASTLKHTLTDIVLNDVNDPALKSIAITDLSITPDLRRARVFIASLSNENDDDILKRMEKAKGFIKKQLAAKMYLKYVPELVFVRDDRRRLEQLFTDLGDPGHGQNG